MCYPSVTLSEVWYFRGFGCHLGFRRSVGFRWIYFLPIDISNFRGLGGGLGLWWRSLVVLVPFIISFPTLSDPTEFDNRKHHVHDLFCRFATPHWKQNLIFTSTRCWRVSLNRWQSIFTDDRQKNYLMVILTFRVIVGKRGDLDYHDLDFWLKRNSTVSCQLMPELS